MRQKLTPKQYEERKVVAQASLNTAVAAFNHCDFKTAWALYKNRSDLTWAAPRFSHIPEYDGQDLKGKTILVCYEQGLGEQLLFASFLPDLVRDAGRVIFECEPRLVSVIQRSFPDVDVISWRIPYDEKVYDADYWVFGGDLGKHYRPTVESFKLHNGYIKPDPVRVEQLKKILGDKKPLVGLSWASSAQKTGSYKTVPFQLFKPLLESTNCVSLQYGSHTESIYSIPDLDLTRDIEGVIALASLCDYIITVSNTVAHIAGALGKRTIVLVTTTYGRHFYWCVDYHVNPFYPTCKSAFQASPGSWEEIVDKAIKKVLTNI